MKFDEPKNRDIIKDMSDEKNNISKENIAPRYKVGVFSKKGSKYGTCFWLNSKGQKIEVTEVYASVEDAKSGYKWDDMEIVSTDLVKFCKPGIPSPLFD